LFRIEDETNIQRYIERLDANNTELAALIKNNKDQIRLFQNQMLVGMAEMVNNKDGFTGAHIRRTKEVVRILVSKMQKDPSLNYSKEFYEDMVAAAPMHDIGKIAIDDYVLCKPGKFMEAEYSEMKTHAEKGAIIIKNLLSNFQSEFFVEIAKNMAGSHHERWDGSGYPYGLKGESIPLEARVMAIADVYDAMTAARVYRGPLCPFQVIEIFEKEGLQKYETEYIMTFLENVVMTYMNERVKLSDGTIGTIVFINHAHLSKPMIQVNDRFLDLTTEPNLSIVKII
jgi:HD-GYP domain-containing protein (c-di-GMP phosphodiesterase class II)